MKDNIVKPLTIFAKLEDTSLDCEGNIFIVIRKDKLETAEVTARKLRRLKNSDCTIMITPFYKREESIEALGHE
jgi:hypothetical protein